MLQLVESHRVPLGLRGPRGQLSWSVAAAFSCFMFLVIFWSYSEALLSIQENKKHKPKVTKSIPVETVTESGAVVLSPNATVNP